MSREKLPSKDEAEIAAELKDSAARHDFVVEMRAFVGSARKIAATLEQSEKTQLQTNELVLRLLRRQRVLQLTIWAGAALAFLFLLMVIRKLDRVASQLEASQKDATRVSEQVEDVRQRVDRPHHLVIDLSSSAPPQDPLPLPK